MNEALAGFWWFEDLSLLMDRGGHVLWAILVLSTVLWMILLTGASEYGSAEPGLLAGGIAEALVTTELGLVSAIPILLLHCAVKTKRDALFSHLEEAASTLAVREAAGCCGACRRDE